MGEDLIAVAQEQIEQNMRDMVVGFIKRKLAEKMRLEDDLVKLEVEISELNTLPLREAYNKYYNPAMYEGTSYIAGSAGYTRGR